MMELSCTCGNSRTVWAVLDNEPEEADASVQRIESDAEFENDDLEEHEEEVLH